MEPQSVEVELQSKIRRLERMGLLALALLIVVCLSLVLQRWAGSQEGDPVAFLLDENRKPHAVVQVTPSGQIRLVSLRADGSLPRLDAKTIEQNAGVALFDAAGKPRVVFGSSIPSGEVTKASLLGGAQAPAAHASSSGAAHSCNLNNPAAPHEAHQTAAVQAVKKEAGEAAAVREEVAPDGSRIKTVLFENLRIDGISPSMTGPRKTHRLALGSAEDKHVWVTGFRAEVLDRNNKLASPQFMCHSALDVVGVDRPGSSTEAYRGQAFTVSQGQTEIAFPPGFAMTVPNRPDLQQDVLVQVLNNNDPQLRQDLNFRATLRYFGDKEARQRKLIPLKLTGGSVSPIIDAATARPQEPVARPAFDEEIFTGPDGRRRTGHWLVPPGKQVLATEIPLNLSKDTTAHYMWMHVHPYAKSVELRDITANKSVWKGRVENDPDPKRAVVTATDAYSSAKGLLLHHDHKYELIATYENPTPRYVDAMASLWMYVRTELD